MTHLTSDAVTRENVKMVAEVFDGEIEVAEVVEKAAKFIIIKRLAEHEHMKEPVRLT